MVCKYHIFFVFKDSIGRMRTVGSAVYAVWKERIQRVWYQQCERDTNGESKNQRVSILPPLPVKQYGM